MKNLGLILVGLVTVPILLLVAVYLLWPQQPQPQPALVISIDAQIAPVEAELAAREAEIQAQLDEITGSLKQQQSVFETQTENWLAEMSQTQSQLDGLQAEAQDLQIQISRLEITRTARLEQYQTELELTRQQNEARLAALEAQLKDARTRLSQLSDQ